MSKLKKLKQLDGKFDAGGEGGLLTLSQGSQTKLKGVNDENDYVHFVVKLDRAELHKHAIAMHEVPVENRNTLEQRLIRRYRKTHAV